MRIFLHSPDKRLYEGTAALLARYGHELTGVRSSAELEIEAEIWDQCKLSLVKKDGEAVIKYQQTAHFFRAVGFCLSRLDELDFALEEPVHFSGNGAMFDCSRNGVLTVERVKETILTLAVLGMNRLMLYTEDTYEIDGYPYFGHFRGRYTREELRECDSYAAMFGIELIPCIQALAHLKTALRWEEHAPLRDTEDILLVGEKRVYDLIRAMIETVSSCFTSRKIHLGMDEAHLLGLGRYLQQNGYCNRFEIIESHLKKVRELCKEQGLSPMIWSDMYFRLLSASGDYYDMPEDADLSAVIKPPEDVSLVYWDYYHGEESDYSRYLDLHKKLADDIVFAGGGWTWNGMSPNYSAMLKTTNASLAACKKKGIRDVFCTLWMDNGAETPVMTALPALALFAEHGFCDLPSEEVMAERLSSLFDVSWKSFMALDKMDGTPGAKKDNLSFSNPSKWLLYQDPLLGIFDGQIEQLELGLHYSALSRELFSNKPPEGPYRELFEYYHTFSELLAKKAGLGLRLKTAYDQKNARVLTHLADTVIPSCIHEAKKLRQLREDIWFSEYKPFGFEVIDIRFGGLTNRLEFAQRRVSAYLEGKIRSIPELEQQRLQYSAAQEGTCNVNVWSDIVTGGVL